MRPWDLLMAAWIVPLAMILMVGVIMLPAHVAQWLTERCGLGEFTSLAAAIVVVFGGALLTAALGMAVLA